MTKAEARVIKAAMRWYKLDNSGRDPWIALLALFRACAALAKRKKK